MSGFFDISDMQDTIVDKQIKQYNCTHCKLWEHCKTPQIKPFGGGRLGILVVGGAVQLAAENSNNRNQGTHYLYLRKRFKEVGISLEDDCWYAPAIRCYSTKDQFGAMTTNACASLLQQDIKRLKPKVIVVTDNIGWDILLSARMEGSRSDGSLWDYAGAVIPDQELKTWIIPLYNTEMLIENEGEMARKKKEYGERYTPPNRFEPHYTNILNNIVEHLNKPVPIYTYTNKVKCANNVEEAIKYLKLIQHWDAFAYDYETTGLAWHRPEQKIYSVSFANAEISYAMRWYPDSKVFMDLIYKILSNDAIKIAHNMAFERSWSIGRAYVEPKNLIHDPMLMAHVYRNLIPTSLKYLLYREFGILGYDADTDEYLKPSKDEEAKYGKNSINRIMDAPVQKVLFYNGLDSLFTYWMAKHFLSLLDKVHQMPGYRLLAEAERPLTHMHLNGMRVNMEALQYWKEVLQERIDVQYEIIMKSEFIHTVWKSGERFKPGSDAHLRTLLYDIMKLKPPAYTNKGLPSTDAESLDALRDSIPIAEPLLEYRRWYKALNTFILGIEREQWDGVLHVYFNTHNVDSYRTSSNKLNLQNIPKHDKEVMQVIRSLLYPSKGNIMTSTDFSQLEVRVIGAISGDRNLIAACLGSLDQHTELSKKAFLLQEPIPKPLRSYVKTNFTFRWMYGGTGMQSAEASWPKLHSPYAKDIFGMDALGHLKANGISTYEQWQEHCAKVEKWLWGELFYEYQAWRRKTYADYLTNGYVYYPNGFTYQGVVSRNALLNAPSQGCGAHVTLNAVRGIFTELEQRGMKSKLICQVHDDIILDVVPSELEDVKKIVHTHMIKKVREYNPWIGTVPMEGVFGASPIDGTWAEVEDEGVLGEV